MKRVIIIALALLLVWLVFGRYMLVEVIEPLPPALSGAARAEVR